MNNIINISDDYKAECPETMNLIRNYGEGADKVLSILDNLTYNCSNNLYIQNNNVWIDNKRLWTIYFKKKYGAIVCEAYLNYKKKILIST